MCFDILECLAKICTNLRNVPLIYQNVWPDLPQTFESFLNHWEVLLALRAGSRGARPGYYIGPDINTKRQDATKNNQMSHANEMRTALPPCGWDKKQNNKTRPKTIKRIMKTQSAVHYHPGAE
jgi:hypothetical protein